MTLVTELLAYYKENTEDFNSDIEKLDSLNGCLGDYKVIPMDELDDLYPEVEPSEILRLAFFGYDDPYAKDDVKSSFNPNRDYFYINGYGNLVSTDERDYSDYLDEEIVEDIIDNASSLDLSDGAQEILEKYEDQEEEEQDNEKQELILLFCFDKILSLLKKITKKFKKMLTLFLSIV